MEAIAQHCVNHPANLAERVCNRCGRNICMVCAFDTAAGSFCPECMTGGPSAHERSSFTGLAVGSVVLAVFGVVAFMFMLMLSWIAPPDASDAIAGIAGFFALILAIGGLALGLNARERARATGSPLALIGVIANSILLGLYLILAMVGVFSKG